MAGYAERLQVAGSETSGDDHHPGHSRVECAAHRGHGIGHVDEGLRSLADRTGRDHFILQCINRNDLVLVLEADINPRAVSRWPNAVRQLAHWNGRDLLKIVGAKNFNLVEPADRDIGEHAVGIAHDINVVGDRTGVEGLQERKRWLPIEYLGLAGVLQGKPDLLAVRRCGDVRTEWARLRNLADNLVIGDGYNFGLRRKRGADIAVFTVGRENRHTRTVGNGDARLFLISRAVEYGDVVLAADDNPHFFAIHRKERFVWGAPNISNVLHAIGRGIDEDHRIRTNCDNRDSAMIRRKPHAMHQQLTLVERTEIGRQRITKADGANELVVDGIGDRDSVGVLFGGVDAVLMADGNIGIGSGRRSLSSDSMACTDESCCEQQTS